MEPAWPHYPGFYCVLGEKELTTAPLNSGSAWGQRSVCSLAQDSRSLWGKAGEFWGVPTSDPCWCHWEARGVDAAFYLFIYLSLYFHREGGRSGKDVFRSRNDV